MSTALQRSWVFPILTAFSGELSPHLSPIMKQLRSKGLDVEVRQVAYEFQKGGNRMLCVLVVSLHCVDSRNCHRHQQFLDRPEMIGQSRRHRRGARLPATSHLLGW